MTEQIGRYLVRGEIGKGGFGVVYRAYDPVMRRDVAIKVLTAIDDPGMLARFRSEPSTTGLLKHKNIITVHDFGEHNFTPYLVMELLEGRSLRDAMDTAPPLPLSEKVAILGEVARGLWHAHQSGVIHRDIKPANIMLLANGGVKILDFGIARLVSPDLTRQTSTGIMVGTPTYMSPEQFEGEEASALSDIFGYGVVSYELLSGVPPFRGPHLAALVKQITTKDPEPLRNFAPDCSEALESFVRLAMAKRTSDRYQSFRDLLFDLAPIEAGFRKERTDAMAEEAERALAAGDLNVAQEIVWRALELDPNHGRNQDLRRRIQRQRERVAMEERWKATVSEADTLLQRNSFDEAIQTLERMRGSLGSDSVADLREDLDTRLSKARNAREMAQRIAALLVEAQDAAKRNDLAAASQGAAQVLALDSGNTVALSLEAWVAAEANRAQNAETERQRREEIARIRRDVREHLAALRFDDAARLVDIALKSYDASRELAGLQDLVEKSIYAARLQAAEALRAEEELQDQEAEQLSSVAAGPKDSSLEATVGAEPQLQAAGDSVKEPDPGSPPAENRIPKAAPERRKVRAREPRRVAEGSAVVPDQFAGSHNRVVRAVCAALLLLAALAILYPILFVVPWGKLLGSPADSPASTTTTRGPTAEAADATKSAAPTGTEPTLKAGDTKVNPKDGLTYVWIPSGTFQMGCSSGDRECDYREKPTHQVTLTKSFWIGQTEVTQQAYQRVIRKNPSHFKGSTLPVESISWTKALSYCQAVDMRLPTEAEWEYAARAGTQAGRYGEPDAIAWQEANSGTRTHEVGGKQANAWGLQDVLGNVYEWVADWYSNAYVPGDTTDPRGLKTGTKHAMRGGGWATPSRRVRLSYRNVFDSEEADFEVGFRCAGH